MQTENQGATQEGLPSAQAIDIGTMQPEAKAESGENQSQENGNETEAQGGETVSAFLTSKHSGDNDAEADTGDSADGTEDGDDEDPDLSLLEDDSTSSSGGSESKGLDEEEEEAFMEIHSENCLKCNTLIPNMKKSFKSCHYSAGNKHCPGESVKIVLRIPLEDIVPRFMAAEKAGDFDRLARLAAKLKTKPEWYRQRVADALAEARAASA